MFATECDDFKVVSQSINGIRPVDDNALSSVTVLAERLEMLKKSSGLFANVKFSPFVQELVSGSMVPATN